MTNLKDVYKQTQAQYDALSAKDNESIYLVDESFSNKNLLLNSDFRINQRGKTTYTTTANNKIYCVDRWIMWNSYNLSTTTPQTVSISNNIISHTCTATGWQGIGQIIDSPARLSGKTVTFSVNGYVDTADKYLKLVICLYKSTASTSSANPTILNANYNRNYINTTSANTISTTVTLPILTNNDKLICLIWNNNTSGTSIYINWAKLEISALLTPYIPPLNKTELLKCQRYYYHVSNLSTHGFLTTSRQNYYISIPLPIKMRISPTIDAVNYSTSWLGYIATGNLTATTNYISKQNVNNSGNAVTFNNPSIRNAANNPIVIVDNRSVVYETVDGTNYYDINNSAAHYEVNDVALDAEIYL